MTYHPFLFFPKQNEKWIGPAYVEKLTLWKYQLRSTLLYQNAIETSYKEKVATAAAMAAMSTTSSSTTVPLRLYEGVQHGRCNPTVNYLAKSSEMLHYLKTRPNFENCQSIDDRLTKREMYLLLALIELEHSNFHDLEQSFFFHAETMDYFSSFMGKTRQIKLIPYAWSKKFPMHSMEALLIRIQKRNLLLWQCLLDPVGTLFFCFFAHVQTCVR